MSQYKTKYLSPIDQVAECYPVRITETMREAMTDEPDDLADDPIAKQFLPSPLELVEHPFDDADPIGDEKHSPIKGIVHRHADRILLKLLHSCPVYCRFCFRKTMVGPQGDMLSEDEIDAALDYIACNETIREIILTGGDPLMLSPRRLRKVCDTLHQIDHVDLIRFHTRVPIVSPNLMSEEKIHAMSGQKAVMVVLHINHAQEFTKSGVKACRDLADAGIPLFNEMVLLKGVNDNVETLTALMQTCMRQRIKPYYMHHLDHAPGTEHFRVSIQKGLELMAALTQRVSGLALPRYVLDLPGGYAKIPLDSQSVKRCEDGAYVIKDPRGTIHSYIDTAQS